MPEHQLTTHNPPNAGDARQGTAPYAYVPVGRSVLHVCELPAQDRYHANRQTGHVDLVVEARTPVYVRGPVSPDDLAAEKAEQALRDDDKSGNAQRIRDAASKARKMRDAFYHSGDPARPVIPGSSWRGAVGGLLTTLSYGRLRGLSDTPVTFRTAVTNPKVMKRTKDGRLVEDPRFHELAGLYQSVIPKNAPNVLAGFVGRDKGGWFVEPPDPIGEAQWGDRMKGKRAEGEGTYARVHAANVDNTPNITGQGERLNPGSEKGTMEDVPDVSRKGRAYKPGQYRVRFTHNDSTPKGGSLTLHTTGTLGEPGVLVFPGNMVELGSGRPRKSAYLVRGTAPSGTPLSRERGQHAVALLPAAVKAYQASLTDWQREHYGESGGIEVGRVLFYVDPNSHGEWVKRAVTSDEAKHVLFFGTTPYFRQVYLRPNAGTYTPASPQALYDEMLEAAGDKRTAPDLPEAVLGFAEPRYGGRRFTLVGVDPPDSADKTRPLREVYAGRVTFDDAPLVSNPEGAATPFLSDRELQLRVLSSGSSAYFPNVLAQGDPRKGKLDDWSSASATLAGQRRQMPQRPRDTPAGSVARGDVKNKDWFDHALHPATGATGDAQAEDDPKADMLAPPVRPVAPGTQFSLRVRFENLSTVEFGALLSALVPHDARHPERRLVHRVGMAKPFGFGALRVEEAWLTLTDRSARPADGDAPAGRYGSLFERNDEGQVVGWHTGQREPEDLLADEHAALRRYAGPFEAELGRVLGEDPARGWSLSEEGRIRELYATLDEEGAPADWRTRDELPRELRPPGRDSDDRRFVVDEDSGCSVPNPVYPSVSQHGEYRVLPSPTAWSDPRWGDAECVAPSDGGDGGGNAPASGPPRTESRGRPAAPSAAAPPSAADIGTRQRGVVTKVLPGGAAGFITPDAGYWRPARGGVYVSAQDVSGVPSLMDGLRLSYLLVEATGAHQGKWNAKHAEAEEGPSGGVGPHRSTERRPADVGTPAQRAAHVDAERPFVGIVNWWGVGVGFIRVTTETRRSIEDRGIAFGSKPDVFVRLASVEGDGFRELQKGETVTFDVKRGREGPEAVRVLRVER
ncbi:MAG: TIGR03986 family CRISPR-associated RAMP protein [Bacteroidota bacterium]